jgi:hypothetical protein
MALVWIGVAIVCDGNTGWNFFFDTTDIGDYFTPPFAFMG